MRSFVESSKVASLVMLVAATLAMHHAGPVPGARVPAVTVSVSMDTGYQREVGDLGCTNRCRLIVAALRDSVRKMLADQFGYVSWSATTPTTDTLELRWINPAPPSDFAVTQLSFVMHGPSWRTPRPNVDVEFEDFERLVARRAAPAAWEPAPLRAEWLPKVKQRLSDEGLRNSVFFTYPLPATIRLFPRRRARVMISPADLGTNASTSPEFSVFAMVRDPQPPTWDQRVILHLAGCAPDPAARSYACDVRVLRTPSRPFEGDELNALLERAVFDSLSVSIYLAKLQPLPQEFRTRLDLQFPDGGSDE